MAIVGGAPVPLTALRVMVCERMHWTLDYFDSLDVHEINALLAVWEAIEKAQPHHG